MAEQKVKETRTRKVRHKGRSSQILIYLGKQLRFFINENDWKVLPMAAAIAALVGMVIRRRFFINMEGSLIGAFALTCVAIWNGCFNSIQSVCRERAIIKREHRSGMHVSSYVFAHMIYQLLLCTAQTGLTMYMLQLLGVQFPDRGFMTRWMIVDIGITMLLISYASDMLSLFISSISHTTTGAMTIMPFVLIFQLVFSGSIIPLPAWSQSLSNYTISNYGIRAIASQSGYNELPMVTPWNTLSDMRDTVVGGTFTVGQLLEVLRSPAVEKRRDMVVMRSYTVGEAADILNEAEDALDLKEKQVSVSITVRDVVSTLMTSNSLKELRTRPLLPDTDLSLETVMNKLLALPEAEAVLDSKIGFTFPLGQVLDFLQGELKSEHVSGLTVNEPVTLGQITDFLTGNQAIQNHADRSFTVKFTVGDLLEAFGEENVKKLVQEKTAAASHKEEFERTTDNIVDNWVMLGIFALAFALLSILVLELIDKDKR